MTPQEALLAATEWEGEAGGALLPQLTANELSGIINEAMKFERDECARMLELNENELLLIAGEMWPQELRTVKAVLAQRARAIRSRSNAY